MQIKKLAIFDLDNTLTDAFAMWHDVTVKALDLICEHFALDREALTKSYRSAPEQYRFADFEKIVGWLDDNGHLPHADTPERQYAKDVTKNFIAGQLDEARKVASRFYDDALVTLRELKAQGVSTAIYTDAEAAPIIRRLWLMAGNTDSRPEDILNLFDHFYCRPSVECDAQVLRDVDPSFVLSMKEKTTLWVSGAYKPVPAHTQTILNDFGVRADEAVFIGDSYKDGGCAVPLGVDFVWYRKGAVASPEAVAVVQSICDPGWSFGASAIIGKFTQASIPMAMMDDMRSLPNLFQFGKGTPCTPLENICSRHLEAQFRNPVRDPGIGPQTHL